MRLGFALGFIWSVPPKFPGEEKREEKKKLNPTLSLSPLGKLKLKKQKTKKEKKIRVFKGEKILERESVCERETVRAK